MKKVRRRSPAARGRSGYGVARTGGALKGTLSNWFVRRLSRQNEGAERSQLSARAQDLAANDALASSIVESLALNVAGTGLQPQANPNNAILGWSDEESERFEAQAEWAFQIWSKRSSTTNLPFWAMQFLSAHSMVMHGEFLRQVVMLDETRHGRRFSFALHALHPSRMYTPCDMSCQSSIRDGIELSPEGIPESYLVEDPLDPDARSGGHSSLDFMRVPARLGHWPGMLHGFVQREEEQHRGVSVLAAGMKSFRDLGDYLDYELVGAIIAASFPIFIEDSFGDAGPGARMDNPNYVPSFQEVAPGQVLFGNPGQKPHVLEHNRPGNSFPAFVERVIRMIGASCGLPYEVVAKDFSKTNYSSARAALLEAWRVYQFYQKWLVDCLCQPCWECVIEEAWLRGMIDLPKGTDFYAQREAITQSMWIPPRRGHVDPVKELNGIEKGREQMTMTLEEAVAETGGDWKTKLHQIKREQDYMERLGIGSAGLAAVNVAAQAAQESARAAV